MHTSARPHRLCVAASAEQDPAGPGRTGMTKSPARMTSVGQGQGQCPFARLIARLTGRAGTGRDGQGWAGMGWIGLTGGTS
jgi:hypothetical protein